MNGPFEGLSNGKGMILDDRPIASIFLECYGFVKSAAACDSTKAIHLS